ncbi:MAG: MliC family protein [Betaproteobacteria bacterium]|nr:MAG: MliC family protein [Betaproteobacteria bacterium]
MGRPGATYVYECGDQSVFTARIEGEKAWLFLRSGTISLPHVEAASGAKYSDGTTTYWSKGESAMLERPGHPRTECKNNRRMAIWEDAKLRGADFRATGNEPGWYMEISEAYGIVFVANYGSDRYHFEEFETNSDAASRETIFKASKDGRELLVLLAGKRCTDSMSGEKFETTVVVTLNETKLNGCGRALH